MATVSELTTTSAQASQIFPQYSPDSGQMQQYKQAWILESHQANDNVSVKSRCEPDKKCIFTMLGMGILIGLFLCGIPLAIIATLYLQQKSSSDVNTGSTGINGGGSISLPSQCTSYISNTDYTRNAASISCIGCQCDTSAYITAGWYRFSGSAGTQLITTPVSIDSCGTYYPGWFNGSLPSTVGATTSGTVCSNFVGTLCYIPYSINSVLVTNCSGFYVYYLTPMSSCNSRYCTT